MRQNAGCGSERLVRFRAYFARLQMKSPIKSAVAKEVSERMQGEVHLYLVVISPRLTQTRFVLCGRVWPPTSVWNFS